MLDDAGRTAEYWYSRILSKAEFEAQQEERSSDLALDVEHVENCNDCNYDQQFNEGEVFFHFFVPFCF
mgnify:CR=1 FL=1